ncbi:MAG: NUDIX domain-containing protein [Patescibacteria group bacterium]
MENISSNIKDKELHRVVTTILIYKPDFTYLITKRALHKKMMPGKWTIPGGGLNTDDYVNLPVATKGAPQWYGVMEISMKREIKEEVNLEIGTLELLTDLAFIRPDGVPCICFSYFTPYVSGEVKLDEDATEFAWVNLEQAKEHDLIDGIWNEIRQIDEILKSRK